MKEIALNQYTPEALNTLLSQIPFFNDLALHDYQQYELLLKHSKVIELAPYESIIRKGDVEQTFYFLLKGQLDVFPDSDPRLQPISQLSPGQVFGALAIINKQPRTASLAAGRQASTLFATDSNLFGEMEDFSQIKLETKLSLLRIVVNNTRWKLEVYRMNEPDHPLVCNIDKIHPFQGEKNTVDELRYLAQQSKALGNILNDWNASQMPSLSELPPKKRGFFSLFGNMRNA